MPPSDKDTLNKTTVGGVQKKRGRRGYDWGSTSSQRDAALAYDGPCAQDIRDTLAISPDHTICHGFVVPPTQPRPESRLPQSTRYTLIGDAYARDDTKDGPDSIRVPKQTVDLVSELHRGWQEQSALEKKIREEMWRSHSDHVNGPAASAYWEEKLVETHRGDDRGRVQTLGRLFIKEQGADGKAVASQLFDGDPAAATEAWWENRRKREGFDSISRRGLLSVRRVSTRSMKIPADTTGLQ